jgi:hypothetical protein
MVLDTGIVPLFSSKNEDAQVVADKTSETITSAGESGCSSIRASEKATSEAIVGRSDSHNGDSYGRDDIGNSVQFLKDIGWADEAGALASVHHLEKMFKSNQIQFGHTETVTRSGEFRLGRSKESDQIILNKQMVTPGNKTELDMVFLLLHEEAHAAGHHVGHKGSQEDIADKLENSLRSYLIEHPKEMEKLKKHRPVQEPLK